MTRYYTSPLATWPWPNPEVPTEELRSLLDSTDACSRVAATTSLRKSATETPAEFVRRITLAVLEELDQ